MKNRIAWLWLKIRWAVRWGKLPKQTNGCLWKNKTFLRFCRTWTKRYLITSQTQTRVKRVSRMHHLTILAIYEDGPVVYRVSRLALVCEVIRYRFVQVWRNLKKIFRVSGPQSPPPPLSLSIYLFLFGSLLRPAPFLSQKKIKRTKHRNEEHGYLLNWYKNDWRGLSNQQDVSHFLYHVILRLLCVFVCFQPLF